MVNLLPGRWNPANTLAKRVAAGRAAKWGDLPRLEQHH